MNKLKFLYTLTEEIYAPNKDKSTPDGVWAYWAWENHVKVVAKNAESLCDSHPEANREFAVAGALLHDIADATMSRFDPKHEEECDNIAQDLMVKAGYSSEEIKKILKEVIAPHSCRELLPSIIEGRILATADGMAHFLTDFYTYFCWNHYGRQDYAEFKKWVLEKIERDYTIKISFEDIRDLVKSNYEGLKVIFSK